MKIVETILEVNTEITEPAQVDTLLDFIKPLIADIPGVEVDEEVRPAGKSFLQTLIAMLSTPVWQSKPMSWLHL